MKWMIQFLELLPKNAISQAFGWLVRQEWPAPMNTWICKAFARLYRINLREASQPIEAYQTLEDFFTRQLKSGIRPIIGPFASPADGTLVYSQPTEQGGRALQVKGIYYNLDELIYGQGITNQHDWTWYTTIYLAPYDYHRVHAPVSGRLTQIRYFPGELWPVNQTFVNLVPQLFSTNERIVFDFLLPNGGKVAVVMVGALNVGRICTPYWPEFFTNDRLFGSYPKTHDLGQNPPQVDLGEEIGTFMLGSTVVIAMDSLAEKHVLPESILSKVRIKMGECLSQQQSLREEGSDA